MDPNAKPATICKKGHKRIWHTAARCPMCGALAWGKKQQELAGKWQGKVEALTLLNKRLYRSQNPEASPHLGEVSGWIDPASNRKVM